jgi:hypothetical protein
MDSTPTKERLSKWRVEYATDLDTQYKEFKRNALADFDRQWSMGAETSKESPPARPTAPRARNRQTAIPSRREMVLEVLPEFQDDTFTRADIQARIIEKYPQLEGSSLSSSVSNILKEMAEKGHLERVERGKRIQDPWIYRLGEGEES